MQLNPLWLVYGLPIALVWLIFAWNGRRRTRLAIAVVEDNRQAGLMEPNSLHPVIDPAKCLGCAACVRACPEKNIFGIIDGKAALIEPTMCVGHGACEAACPTRAITLVFGTAERGVDIPVLSPDFETSVPGIFIAGELGGMGLVKNAIEQGRQAMDAIAVRLRKSPRSSSSVDLLDVVIVGCGPAGISASLAARKAGLTFETLDQSTLGGTVAHFPRGKLVMTAPAELPIIGKVNFGEISKDDLIAFWHKVIADTGLQPRFDEQVLRVVPEGTQFSVISTTRTYRTRTVLLAIGRRGTPRALGVPGEELAKVVYRLTDPEQYAGLNVLVVGGGDSALEAAASIASLPDTFVTLSYRGKTYGRAKGKNRRSVEALVAAGRITQMLESTVESIEPEHVSIGHQGAVLKIANDIVIVCAGGVLPTQFLQDCGINCATKFGEV